MLFDPFDIEKWLGIGFCAWVARLGEGVGAGFNFNFPGGDDISKLKEGFGKVHDYFHGRDLGQIISGLTGKSEFLPVICLLLGITFLSLGIVVLFAWVKSRFEFVFMDCISNGDSRMAYSWSEYSRCGNSLFLVNLLLSLLSLAVFAGLLSSLVFCLMRFSGRDLLCWMAAAAAISIVIFAFLSLFGFCIRELCIPLMFRRKAGFASVFHDFCGLLLGNASLMVVYLLGRIVLGITISFAIMIASLFLCCLCCCAFFAIMLPYVWAVVFLPLLVFNRAMGMELLSVIEKDGQAV